MSQAVRWTIKVSSETDLALRTFLGARGMKKGDLSRFVEEAVRWRVFDQTVQDVKQRNQGLPPEALEQAIDEAVRAVREEMAGSARSG
jgi:hypothetical protein